MEIYDLLPIDRWGEQFASLGLLKDHPWANPDELCEACYQPEHRMRSGPYTVAWEAGSDVIGDFMFTGPPNGVIVTERVKVAFENAGFSGYVGWPLEIKEPAKRRKSHRRPMVSYPYVGPPLWDLMITEYVHVAAEESTLCFEGLCQKCGRKKYDIDGDAEDLYFVVDRQTWNGCDFMCPHVVNSMFVTQRVVDVIRENGFTNVEIRHIGRISD